MYNHGKLCTLNFHIMIQLVFVICNGQLEINVSIWGINWMFCFIFWNLHVSRLVALTPKTFYRLTLLCGPLLVKHDQN